MDLGDAKYTVTLIDKASDKMKSIGDSMGDLRGSMLKVAGMMAAAAAAVTATFAVMLKSWSNAGDAMMKMAQKTGWGVESISEMDYVAKQTGTNLNVLEAGILGLSRAIVNISDKTAVYKKALEGLTPGTEEYDKALALVSEQIAVSSKDFVKLGIDIDDLRKMSPEDQFWAVAEAIARVEDPTLRSTIAIDLLGTAGADLLPMMQLGMKGIDEMRQKAKDFHGTFTEESGQAASDFKGAMGDMQLSLDGLKAALVGESGLAPALTDLIELHINPAIKNLSDFIAKNQDLKDAIIEVADAIGKIVDALVVMFGWLVKGYGVLNKMPGGFGTFLKGTPAGSALAALPGAAEEISAFGAGGRRAAMEATAPSGYVPSGVGDVNITINGNFMGDDAALRQLVAELEPYFAESQRRTSFPPINQGYFPGSTGP